MAIGVNKVFMIGNLGADPETKYLPNGNGVTTFRLAVTETWKDKQTGQLQERTEWMTVEAWGALGEACAKYCTKGKQVFVEGSFKTDSWEGDDGKKKYQTKVRASNVQFLGAPRDDAAPKAKPPAAPAQPDFDDDIPF